MTYSFIVIAAEYFFLIPVVTGGIYFLFASRKIKKRMIVLSAIALPLTFVCMFILNHVYQDTRTETALTFTPLLGHIFQNGFPSTHAALTALIAAIMYVFNRKIGLFLFAISIIVSISRVYLGLHHPIDVVASIILAIFITWLSQTIIHRYFHTAH